jgi:ABC-type transporter Mla subunit MlaD
MERAVGWFVFFATALLLFGFGYYLYHVAESRGWFIIKARFHTYVSSSAGLNVGDSVTMMGFPVGRILWIHAMPPGDTRNVRVEFEVRDPYFRYIWTEGSYAKVNAAGFLNQRQIEVTRATNGYAICVTQPITVFTNIDELKQMVLTQTNQWQLAQDAIDENSNVVFRAYTRMEKVFNETNAALLASCRFESNSIYAYNNSVNKNRIVAAWDGLTSRYEPFTETHETAWLRAVESPPVSDELQAMVQQVKAALPGILALTNQLAAVLNNSAQVTSNLNFTVIQTHPILTNANSLIAHMDTNVTANLINLANITSNLNAQVQANSNMLSGLSKSVTDADTFIQGLKHHWLLRSAFKDENKKKTATPEK